MGDACLEQLMLKLKSQFIDDQFVCKQIAAVHGSIL